MEEAEDDDDDDDDGEMIPFEVVLASACDRLLAEF